jgi:membrane protease YdiL (CAAX protease family)
MTVALSKNLFLVTSFIFIAITCGWVGRLIDAQTGQTGTQTLGTLIWLLTPFVLSIIFKITQKNKFEFPKSADSFYKYLAVSILFYPVVIGLSVLFSTIVGNYSLANFVFKPEIFVGIVISALIKNVFEEFAWRGYLTAKLYQIGFSNLLNHGITGLTWGLWHLPYFLFLNPSLRLGSTQEYVIYCIQFLISVLVVSVIYGELRLRSGNIWFGYILHVLVNIITATIIMFGMINTSASTTSLIFSPFDGLIYSALVILITLFTQRKLFKPILL